jgi:hypothetical protein
MKTLRLISYIALCCFLISCEEEGEPLTSEDFINEDFQKALFKPFFARVDAYPFNSEGANLEFNGSQLIVSATNENGEQISFSCSDYRPGVYLGGKDGINQVTYFRDNAGYSSLSADGENSAVITIQEYDEENSTVSGTFQAELLVPDSRDVIVISDGQFNDQYVYIPFTGKMNAQFQGKLFESDNCSYVSSSNQGATIETIQGIGRNDSTTFTIIIREALQLKSYDVSSTEVSVSYNSNVFDSSVETQYVEQSGTVEITEINPQEGTVKGTFNVEVQNFNGKKLNFQMGTFEAKSL